MRKVFFKDLPAFQFHLLQKFSDQADHAVFSRMGGVSKKPYDSLNVRFGIGDRHENVIENRRRICEALVLESDKLVSANQTHSKNVTVVECEVRCNVENRVKRTPQRSCAPLRRKPNGVGELRTFEAENNNVGGIAEIDDTDAMVTALKGVGLMVQVADCQAILMFDPVKGVAAAVHAGWKGLAGDVIGETVKVMRTKFGVAPENILAGVAPSLGPCCAFFSNPEKELPSSFHKFIDARKRVDLWSFSIEQLQKHGILRGNIEFAKVCTQCGNGKDIDGSHNFFSFRGEQGITGRFGAVIAVR